MKKLFFFLFILLGGIFTSCEDDEMTGIFDKTPSQNNNSSYKKKELTKPVSVPQTPPPTPKDHKKKKSWLERHKKKETRFHHDNWLIRTSNGGLRKNPKSNRKYKNKKKRIPTLPKKMIFPPISKDLLWNYKRQTNPVLEGKLLKNQIQPKTKKNQKKIYKKKMKMN